MPNAALSSVVSQGNTPCSWNTIDCSGRPSCLIEMSIAPTEGVSSPARMRSSVVFPQPLGPTMQRNSPSATNMSIVSSALTGAGRTSNVLASPRIAIPARAWVRTSWRPSNPPSSLKNIPVIGFSGPGSNAVDLRAARAQASAAAGRPISFWRLR